VFCAGYTSGSDLQGEAAVEAREDCRSSVENCERPTTAAEWTKTLPSKRSFWLRQLLYAQVKCTGKPT